MNYADDIRVIINQAFLDIKLNSAEITFLAKKK